VTDMNGTAIQLRQPLAYRIWDPRYRSYFYTDAQPESLAGLERWTGLFDKQGIGLYENDIIRVHYDWKYGWVRARIVWDAQRRAFTAKAAAPEGSILNIGFYNFADAYHVGNIRQHPGKLTTAKEQFSQETEQPWWLSPAIFRNSTRSQFN
jgi:hypothetical protein